jgi:4-amino-4-deoxy-L-arabinose transferase-like glycosyltransferase
MRLKQGQHLDIFLICIVLLSAFLNLFNIWQDQYANAYYTAAVTSMLQSWHNFFYASFDPGGYVTVDKPPVAFWVQTVFAYVFGVHGWSVILPQALAGVGSVLLMYFLIKPAFGKTAARLASLIMACTPIAVAVSRTNNIDSLLLFTLLLAAWMLFRGIRTQKLFWVFGSFAMIGVGFNMKMLQAYMVVPAFYLLYLLAFNSKWKKKLAVLAAATVILVGVSASWAVVVDTIPQENRPYIGGSKTNSVLELALGYNGISRLMGNRGGNASGAAPNQRQMQQYVGNMPNPQLQQDGNNRPGDFGPDVNGRPGPMPGSGGGGPPGRGGGGAFGTGQAGPLRLLQSELSGQISWLLPFVAFACVGLLAGTRLRKPLTNKQNETLYWMAWLLPSIVFFSVAGFFHHYYLIMLAPPIAALAGAGWVELWNRYRGKEGWKRWLLPAGLLSALVFELYVLQPYQGQIGTGWSIGIGAAGIGLSLLLFIAAKNERLSSLAALAGMLVLLAAPLYWAFTPLLYGGNSMLPQAGPSGRGSFGQAPSAQKQDAGGVTNPGAQESKDKLLEYVTNNNTGEKYLFATTDSNTAAPYIIKTGEAVMAMGGFGGGDSILTVEKLKQMVANKEVKYFLIPSGSDSRGGGGNNEIMDWIRLHSTEVPKEEWQTSSGGGTQGGNRGGGPMGNDKLLYKIN